MFIRRALDRFHPSQSQHGMVLVIAMVMVFALTLITLTMMRANVSEERMANNARDWNRAFQAAEAALHDAERDILTGTRISGLTGFPVDSGCNSDGLCKVSSSGTPVWISLTTSNDPGWVSGQDANSKTVKYGEYTDSAPLDGVAAQPRYIIEGMSVRVRDITVRPPKPPPHYFYRVTAVGFGANITTRVMLQGVYRQY